MEIWLIFAIASVFFAGGYNFAMKVISQRNYNISFAPKFRNETQVFRKYKKRYTSKIIYLKK